MDGLAFLWFVFALLFFGLGFFHFGESRRSISPFEVTQLKRKQTDVEFVTSLTDVNIESL
jgi:hypothetical protein